eukprot:1160991-Pelagomonas_calceolata.AAC.1
MELSDFYASGDPQVSASASNLSVWCTAFQMCSCLLECVLMHMSHHLCMHSQSETALCALALLPSVDDGVQQLAVDLSKLEEALGRFEKCGLSKEDRDLLCSHLILPGMAKVQEDLEARHQEATAARGLWESAKKAEKQAYEEYDNMQARIDS